MALCDMANNDWCDGQHFPSFHASSQNASAQRQAICALCLAGLACTCICRWTDQSSCENSALITRTRVGVQMSNLTVSQQSLALSCGVNYAPTTSEINEDLTELGMDVSATYTYCVQDQGDPSTFMTVLTGAGTASPRLQLASYMSAAVCMNKTIEWAGTVEVSVATTRATPVAGINVSHSDFISFFFHCIIIA